MADENTKPEEQEPKQPAQEPKEPEPKRVASDDLPPEALRQRLEREAKKARTEGVKEWLSANGFSDESEAKAALEELKSTRESRKTLEERMAEAQAELTALKSRSGLAELVLTERYELELSKLSESQRAAVAKLAGEDKVKALQAIDTLAPTWAARAPKVEEKPAEQKPTLPQTPGKSAPQETTTSPPDHKAIWEDMRERNPFAAARYYTAHKAEIFPSQ